MNRSKIMPHGLLKMERAGYQLSPAQRRRLAEYRRRCITGRLTIVSQTGEDRALAAGFITAARNSRDHWLLHDRNIRLSRRYRIAAYLRGFHLP